MKMSFRWYGYDDPVKIVSSIGGGTLTVSVYGKKAADKTVEIFTERISTIPFSTREEVDETLAEGQTKTDQAGSNGAVVNTYKKVTENGKVTFNGFIHKSVYSPITKVVLVPPLSEPVEDIPVDGETPNIQENTSSVGNDEKDDTEETLAEENATPEESVKPEEDSSTDVSVSTEIDNTEKADKETEPETETETETETELLPDILTDTETE